MFGTEHLPSNQKKDTENIAEKLLVKQASKGDKEAFAKLYLLYYDRIVSHLFRYTNDFGVAEELAQQTFLKAFEHISRYEDQGYTFGAWLFVISHNLRKNYQRRVAGRTAETAIEVVFAKLNGRTSNRDEVPQTLLQRELLEILKRAISELSPEHRQVVEYKLTTDWGMSNLEIGAVLGKSESAVKSLYRRALLRLEKLLEGKI